MHSFSSHRLSIRIRRPQGASPLPQGIDNLDPEELKDALLQQAIAQRRALVSASLRPGTGREVKRATFSITIRAPVSPRPLSFEDIDGPATTSQLAQLNNNNSGNGNGSRTPAGLLAHYPSPVEGVPERVLLSSGGRNGRVVLQPSPLYNNQPSRFGSNNPYGGRKEDSPIEGLVHDRNGAPGAGGRVVDGDVNADATRGGGFAFANANATATAAIQTGTSLLPSGDGDGGAEEGQQQYNNDAFEDDDFGGGGGGGWDDDGAWGGDGGDGGGGGWDDDYAAMPPPPPVSTSAFGARPPPPPRQPRRLVLNPGVNLRKQLPRQSLAEAEGVGRKEVAPGIRRTTRQAHQPLKWWLGEKKEFDRTTHLTMPTVRNMTHTDPNTPWRTVPDPKEYMKGKKKKKSKKGKCKAKKAVAAAGEEEKKARKKKTTTTRTKKTKTTTKKAAAGTATTEGGDVEEVDDEVHIRTAGTATLTLENSETENDDDVSSVTEQQHSDDEETLLLPRDGDNDDNDDDEDSGSESDGDDANDDGMENPTPVRAIDLSSPTIILGGGGGAAAAATVRGDDPEETVPLGQGQGTLEAGAEAEPTVLVGGNDNDDKDQDQEDDESWGNEDVDANVTLTSTKPLGDANGKTPMSTAKTRTPVGGGGRKRATSSLLAAKK